MFFIPFLQAAGSAPSASAAGGLLSFAPFLIVILIMYFFLIRPQNKKQKETEKMIAALKKGDKVVTIGGIHGVVSSVKEKTIIVKVDEDCKIEFNRTAISAVENVKAEAPAEADAKKAKKDKKEKSEKEEDTTSSDK